MNVSTWNVKMNDSEIDFEYVYTIADAVDVAEFWETVRDVEIGNDDA